MPRGCTVCRCEAVDDVNRRLLDGASYRDIAKQFQLSSAALHRHKQHHLGPLLVAANETRGEDLLAEVSAKLEGIEREARRLSRLAEKKGDYRTAGTLLVAEARQLLELSARLKGLLRTGARVKVGAGVAVREQHDPHAALANLVGRLPDDLRERLAAFLKQERETSMAERIRQVDAKIAAQMPDGWTEQVSTEEREAAVPEPRMAEMTGTVETEDGCWSLYRPEGADVDEL